MGCGSSKLSPEEQESNRASKEIDKTLAKELREKEPETKILLLGAGESGKSTVLKQMQLLYSKGYDDSERAEYREVIVQNLLLSMQTILHGMTILDIELDNPDNLANAGIILRREYMGWPPEEGVLPACAQLLEDRGVLHALDRRNEIQLNDSADYYFESIPRLAENTYVPTDEDILRVRIKTTGITETRLKVGNLRYRVVDVGGQR